MKEKTRINFWVPKDLKEKFYEKCEENLQVPSLVLRRMIENFLEEESTKK